MTTMKLSSGSGGSKATLERGYDAIAGSPARFLRALGVALFLVAVVLQDGTWAAILGVWGVALVVIGLSLSVAAWWTRR